MFISPYDTTVGKTLKGVNQARTALEVAYVGKLLSGQGGVENAPVIELLDGREGLADIARLGHPLSINTVMDGRKIVLDQRPYARVPANTSYAGSATDITNAREYNFMAARGWFQVGWETISPTEFLRLSPVPMRVFAEWIAGQLTQKLGLDDQQQRDVKIVAAWYWHCLFVDDLDSQDKLAVQRSIQGSLRFDYQIVALVTQNLPHLKDMEAFTKALQASNISLRLRTINPAVLFQITSFSWVGGQAKEVVGIALEHPPTFILLCLSGADDRGYKDTLIGRLMRDQRKLSNDVANFQRNSAHLLEKCRGITSL